MYCPVCSEHLKEVFKFGVDMIFLHDLSKHGRMWRKCRFCGKTAEYLASYFEEDED